MDSTCKVINFYKFTPLEKPDEIRQRIQSELAKSRVLGTILLAEEGLNGSLAGKAEDVDDAFARICDFKEFSDLSQRASFGQSQPFKRLIVKVKPQILGFPLECDPSVQQILEGPSLGSDEWAKVLEQNKDEVVILDTRNRYEYELGSFAGARDLNISRFREFPEAFLENYGDKKDQTFLMFCTGGIRCEKAVAFARQQGFQKVYQLDGGIIQYFEKQGEKHWQGECFVFDQRWSIGSELQEGKELAEFKAANKP